MNENSGEQKEPRQEGGGDEIVDMDEAMQIAEESFGAYIKVFIAENKWLMAFIIVFLVLMLLPLVFRGPY